jgi:hypothetical protein
LIAATAPPAARPGALLQPLSPQVCRAASLYHPARSASATAAARLLPTVHTSVRSSRADGAMPRSRPRCAGTGRPARRPRSRLGLDRRSLRCPWCTRLDASRGRNHMTLTRVVRDAGAGALRDRADMHVAIVDVPAVLALGIAAAGELGHAPECARPECGGKLLRIGGRPESGLPLVALSYSLKPRRSRCARSRDYPSSSCRQWTRRVSLICRNAGSAFKSQKTRIARLL